MAASQTPVMRQYFAAKAAHPEALLFFRMGDFYELFYDDAVVAARALDLTLTARNKGAVEEVPMAGVPHHAASSYVQKLLEKGFSVAICEQMADPSKTKGLVPRQVVRVVTPGIAYDDAGLEARQNHYLAAVERGVGGQGPLGVAALDLSTGELLCCEVHDVGGAVASSFGSIRAKCSSAQERAGWLRSLRTRDRWRSFGLWPSLSPTRAPRSTLSLAPARRKRLARPRWRALRPLAVS
jgi:DNA mismatch repair ATPase MutS